MGSASGAAMVLTGSTVPFRCCGPKAMSHSSNVQVHQGNKHKILESLLLMLSPNVTVFSFAIPK